MIKTLDLNFSGTKMDVVPKQRPDRFPSIEDHMQVTPTFEHTWATPKHTEECFRFLSVHGHSNYNT